MEFWLKKNRVIIEMLPMKGWCGMRKKSSGASHAVPAPLLIVGADGCLHKSGQDAKKCAPRFRRIS